MSTYRTLFEWLPVPVLLLDERLSVVLANRAAGKLLQLANVQTGIPLMDLIGHNNVAQLARDSGDRRSKVLEVEVPARGRRSAMTLRITSTRLVNNSGASTARRAIGNGNLTPEFRLLVLEDVTDTVALEDQLVEAEKRAGMGQLAAGIAHELANPLTCIVSNLTYIRESVSGPGRDAVLEAIEATAEQVADMHQLVSVLSGFTRQHRPRYELVDVQDLIRRAVTFIAKEAERRHVQLAISLAPASLECEMDARVMRHVLLNLLKNAMEAMPNGGRLDIKTLFRPAGQFEPQAAMIQIADSGIGIAETDLRKIFRPLYSTKPGGTGLGLPFCRQAVEEHGGEIRVESRRGVGTTITVILPVRQARGSNE